MSLDDLKISVSSPKELDSFKYLDVLERRLNCDVDERDAVLLRHFFLSIYSILAGRQASKERSDSIISTKDCGILMFQLTTKPSRTGSTFRWN
ncbi:hypothetical protein YQE_07677, partial [Dendroctonus ponderosae]